MHKALGENPSNFVTHILFQHCKMFCVWELEDKITNQQWGGGGGGGGGGSFKAKNRLLHLRISRGVAANCGS